MRRLAIFLAALVLSTSLARAEGGHYIRFLADGKSSFGARAKNIGDADVILYKTYIFANDETGQDTIRQLVERAKAGKQVFVEFDARGTTDHPLALAKIALLGRSPIPAYMQPLLDAGVHVLPMNRPRLGSIFLGRDHEKLLVTWKRGEAARAIVGGMNVGDKWANGGYTRNAPSTPGHLDADMEMVGPQVSRVVDRFVEAARMKKIPVDDLTALAAEMKRAPETFAPQGNDSHIRFFTNDPKGETNPRRLERLYTRLLRSTPVGETVELANPYLVPSRALRSELLAAANRGVKIRMLVNSEKQSEMPMKLTALALRSDLRTLWKKMPPGSLEVHEWDGNAARNEMSIHGKVASFGKKGPVVVASFNLDSLSANTNSEEVTLVHDAKFRRSFDTMMKRSFAAAKPITYEQLKAQPLWKRATQRVIRTVMGRVL